jgi:hypothetical protein
LLTALALLLLLMCSPLCRPRWFMQPQHTNPSDAVLIHQEVRSKKSIGVHCCTFNLTTGTCLYRVGV